ncbi:hypothetical protein FXB40_39720 [Bradyrhizobium rifense]|uniref:Uncharacterized protein n=1 Tax=Bradyrhizobium rifense TaxID=515499 RepID=A0A5D3KDE2_9BRAD|nr:hypothetical protein FXB40_39720 [Bradyrhizobium rifense]
MLRCARNDDTINSVILRCAWRDAQHRAGSLEGCTATLREWGRRPSRAAEEAATVRGDGDGITRAAGSSYSA